MKLTGKETAVEVLRELEAWFCANIVSPNSDDYMGRQPEEVQKLWNVLSCLRGPDSDNYDLKASTTAQIRLAVLGHYVRHIGLIVATCLDFDLLYRTAAAEPSWGHFQNHVRYGGKTIEDMIEVAHDLANQMEDALATNSVTTAQLSGKE